MGSSKTPKTPPAPDPNAVAAAQGGANIDTAIANAYMGNANVSGPLGSVKNTTRTKMVKVLDAKGRPVIDKATGKVKTKRIVETRNIGGRNIPMFDQKITLDPAQQKLLDQQNQLGALLNDTAIQQSQRLSQHLNTPVNLDGLPEGASRQDTDFEPYRRNVEAAMFERLNPQLDRDYARLENRLVNQGLRRGSEAFTEKLSEHGRNANDARTQIFLASGNEARAAGGEERARGAFNQQIRDRALQERLTMRNQPLNEVAALMNGGQVSIPQFQQFNAPTVANTPIGDYIYQSADLQRRDAATKASSNAQMFNTMGTLGAGLFKWSDRRLKTDIRYIHTDENGIDWYTFRYRWGGEPQYGVMAQEIMRMRPDAVIHEQGSGFLYVDYGVL